MGEGGIGRQGFALVARGLQRQGVDETRVALELRLGDLVDGLPLVAADDGGVAAATAAPKEGYGDY